MKQKDQQPKLLLVRGLLGAYMPGHFRRVQEHFRRAEFEVEIAPTLPHGTFQQNAKRLAQYFSTQSDPKSVTVLAHSKSGIEALLALKDRHLQNCINSVVLMQTPRRGAPYLSSLFRDIHPRPNSMLAKSREALHASGLTVVGAKPACLELATRSLFPEVIDIENTSYSFPIYSFSSFSKSNSGWIELQAGRIEELEPGKSNDGVFLTEDQVWPKFRHQELPFELDHAEPTVGSARIQEARLWDDLLKRHNILPRFEV